MIPDSDQSGGHGLTDDFFCPIKFDRTFFVDNSKLPLQARVTVSAMHEPLTVAKGDIDARVAIQQGQPENLPSGRGFSMETNVMETYVDELMRNAIQSCEHTPIHAFAEHIRSKPPDRKSFRTLKEYYDALSSKLFEALDMSKSVLLHAGARSSGPAKHIGMSTVI